MISIREKLKQKEVLVGVMIRISRDPAVMPVLRNAGMDMALIDMEHSSLSIAVVSDLIQAANAVGLGSIVRVPEITKGWVSRVLDLGASGILAPMVSSVREAETLVRYAKYPPYGARSIATMTGHTDYASASTPEVMKWANENVLAIAQIESKEGVSAVDEIAAIEGIDALLVGPNDLSVSLGIGGDVSNPQIKDSIGKMIHACKKHGKIAGAHMTVKLNREWLAPRLRSGQVLSLSKRLGHGLRLAFSGTDTQLLQTAAADVVKGLLKQ